jgi:hypothetical protein
MKRRSLRLAILFSVLSLLSGYAELKAQILTPYLSKEGISAAETQAKSAIGSDAILTYIGTFGNIDTLGFQSKFNLDNGKSQIWGYVFYSPSTQQTTSIAVAKIVIQFVPQDLGNIFPFTLSTQAVDVSQPYSNSDKLVERLKTDTAFQRYRTELKDASPDFVSYGQSIIPTGVPLPDNFPTDQPVWTVSFVGGGDSTMTCFVGAKTGVTICQRIQLPTLSVPQNGTVQGTAALTVTPNPVTGMTRVRIALPEGVHFASGAGLALYNATGAKVLDLTGSLVSNDLQFAEFDSRTLPAGIYYCRAIGSNWNGTVGVVVEK